MTESGLPPGWEYVSCICCCGLQWGSDEPRECRYCKGMGNYVRHIKSGAMALYPGGPFIGRELSNYKELK